MACLQAQTGSSISWYGSLSLLQQKIRLTPLPGCDDNPSLLLIYRLQNLRNLRRNVRYLILPPLSTNKKH